MANKCTRHPGMAAAEAYRMQQAEQQRCVSCNPIISLIIPDIQERVVKITDWASI